MRANLLLFIFGLLFIFSISAQESETISYPTFKVDGSFKNKYEYATDTNMSRFSIRNSRIGVRGNINTFSSYRAQVELSDEG